VYLDGNSDDVCTSSLEHFRLRKWHARPRFVEWVSDTKKSFAEARACRGNMEEVGPTPHTATSGSTANIMVHFWHSALVRGTLATVDVAVSGSQLIELCFASYAAITRIIDTIFVN